MSYRIALAVAVLVMASAALASLSSVSVTSGQVQVGPGRLVIRQYRCDVSGGLSGDGPNGGETCATGNWWPAVDARGAQVVSLYSNEYGTGSGAWSLWNCQDPAGRGALTGVDAPGTEDPSNTPTPAEPDPLCAKINLDSAGDPLPITGTGLKEIHWHARNFDFLVVRTDDCTNDCDASLELQVRW